MEEKYYTIALNKKIDKKNELEVVTLNFLKPKFKVFKSEHLYLQFKSGIIACQDAYYGEYLRHMPIIIKENENGLFITSDDHDYDINTDVIYPVVLYNELSKEEVEYRFSTMKNDSLSWYSYRESVKEYLTILEEYKDFCAELNTDDKSFIRSRNNKNK